MESQLPAVRDVLVVQVRPLVLVADVGVPELEGTAQKIPSCEDHASAVVVAELRAPCVPTVHVSPSGLVAEFVDDCLIMQNKPSSGDHVGLL